MDSSISPSSLVRALLERGAPSCLLFDSSRAPLGGGTSYVLCQATQILTEDADGFVEEISGERVADPIAWLLDRAQPQSEGGDNFESGWAGFFGFEAAWLLDRINTPAPTPSTPRIWVGRYEACVRREESSGRWTLHGDEKSEGFLQLASALEALRDLGEMERRGVKGGSNPLKSGEDVSFESHSSSDRHTDANLKPHHATHPEVSTMGPGGYLGVILEPKFLSVSKNHYKNQVQKAIQDIAAGELFEVCYTERFQSTWKRGGIALYEALYRKSSGSHFGFLDAKTFQISSVSPERFLSIRQNIVETHPIKGTSPRSDDPIIDEKLARDLESSPKNRAENIMIVDLMRSDLTQVCELGSVKTTNLCQVESFEGIHHLVSRVEGRVEKGLSSLDVFLSCFPPGSISGAPKLRSIEWIAAHESTPRGPYTGSLFLLSDTGFFESNVLIRTATLCKLEVEFGAGGAVVTDSDPEEEFAEALIKARSFLSIL